MRESIYLIDMGISEIPPRYAAREEYYILETRKETQAPPIRDVTVANILTVIVEAGMQVALVELVDAIGQKYTKSYEGVPYHFVVSAVEGVSEDDCRRLAIKYSVSSPALPLLTSSVEKYITPPPVKMIDLNVLSNCGIGLIGTHNKYNHEFTPSYYKEENLFTSVLCTTYKLKSINYLVKYPCTFRNLPVFPNGLEVKAFDIYGNLLQELVSEDLKNPLLSEKAVYLQIVGISDGYKLL